MVTTRCFKSQRYGHTSLLGRSSAEVCVHSAKEGYYVKCLNKTGLPCCAACKDVKGFDAGHAASSRRYAGKLGLFSIPVTAYPEWMDGCVDANHSVDCLSVGQINCVEEMSAAQKLIEAFKLDVLLIQGPNTESNSVIGFDDRCAVVHFREPISSPWLW